MVRIVVGVKWVPNTQAVRFDPKTGTLIREGVPSIVNPHDLPAVELALRLKEKYGGEVIALSMAPPSAVKGLEHVIGMGVDRAVLVSDRVFAGADTLATSYVVAKAIEKISREFGNVDLAIFGQETIDSSTAHIGAQTASWLGWPYIYYVTKAEIHGDVVRVERYLEDRIEEYELKMPAVLSVAMKSLKPRPVTLYNKIRVKTENPITVWSNKELGLDTRCIGLRGSPTIVAKITWTPEVPRKKIVYKPKDPEDAVEWLLEQLLKDEKTAKLIRSILG
ncbi:MAG: electron transfer flavoprotein subunit beta/FixA family protein [Desulfurococcales archaeon]|nr:electron transfer flavoprotein subunit beta/FixA family protein [Desulfurococcales archaeon]